MSAPFDQTGSVQRASDLFTREEIERLRRIDPWKSVGLLVHCWGTILATWVLVAAFPNPVTVLVGIAVVGARQLGLGVIQHEAAHFLLLRNRRLNDALAEWLCNRPLFGASVLSYRRYHLDHHRFTQQPNDPDLGLSAPFPITRSSFRRKVLRDLTGRTAFKQRSGLIRAVLGPAEDAAAVRAMRILRRFGPNLAINAGLFAGFVVAGHPWLYLLLWVVPAFTWEPLVTRVRNIGEHACVSDNDDRLRNTRTTHANRLERLLVAPYYVNYHLEHHLLVSMPCYNLPEAHRLLVERGLAPRMELEPGYPAMLRHCISKPETAAA